MFDYFRNYSSNARQVCCDDNSTKGLYDHCLSDDLDLQGHKYEEFELLEEKGFGDKA